MHVHAEYSLQLASLGASRDEIQEIAARRSAEVRRKLSLAAGTISDTGEGVSAVAPRTEDQHQSERQQDPDSDTFGRLLSVRA